MLKLFATSTNPTCNAPYCPSTTAGKLILFTIGDNAPGGYWSVIEIDVGIFCLCMPAMRSLLGRLFPSMFGSTKEDSSMRHTSSQKKIRTVDGPNTSFVQLISCGSTKHKKQKRRTERGGRTRNLEIKSLTLYRLS